MFPYKDDNPTSTTPFVTVGLILLNVLVFAWEFFSPRGATEIAFFYGAIPSNLMSFESVHPQPVSPAMSILTSMFLHGGILHVAGNMLYLWIFGDNIEDSLGHLKFLLFYLFSGVAAAYSHAAANAHSAIPMIGASGAVSGILGAYLLLFPHARVHTFVIFGFFWQIIRIPAVVVILFWVVIQLVSGLTTRAVQQGGVAWFAHLGGFLAGVLTIVLWRPARKRIRG
ncbi:MAG: rhomboid family intramembrane serine protease [Nitrospirales bacterium]|nr:rhomboid family intramembrane serine protease [Nitrospirales bacterium]